MNRREVCWRYRGNEKQKVEVKEDRDEVIEFEGKMNIYKGKRGEKNNRTRTVDEKGIIVASLKI